MDQHETRGADTVQVQGGNQHIFLWLTQKCKSATYSVQCITRGKATLLTPHF